MKSSRRPLVNTAVVALVAVIGMSACTSDPSARRVAEDLVKTETQDEPVVQECMLQVIDDYDTEYGLDTLGDDAQSDNAEIAGPANATLDEFEADLAACR